MLQAQGLARQVYMPQRPQVKDKSNVCSDIKEHLSTETRTCLHIKLRLS